MPYLSIVQIVFDKKIGYEKNEMTLDSKCMFLSLIQMYFLQDPIVVMKKLIHYIYTYCPTYSKYIYNDIDVDDMTNSNNSAFDNVCQISVKIASWIPTKF